MHPHRTLTAAAAFAATVAFGLTTDLVHDHASDGAGQLAPVIASPARASTTTTLARLQTTVGRTGPSSRHDRDHDADD